MEATLITQIKKDWMYEDRVQKTECYEISKQQIAVSTTTNTPYCALAKRYNLDRNRVQNKQQQQYTILNPSNSNSTH